MRLISLGDQAKSVPRNHSKSFIIVQIKLKLHTDYPVNLLLVDKLDGGCKSFSFNMCKRGCTNSFSVLLPPSSTRKFVG